MKKYEELWLEGGGFREVYTDEYVEALENDAARYRWLRENALWDDDNGEMQLCRGIRCHRAPNKADIDAAIDTAMKGEGK